jgi:hypothetical protein
MKNGSNIEEEEAKRKFLERGHNICEFLTRERCYQSKGITNNCTKSHIKRIEKTS